MINQVSLFFNFLTLLSIFQAKESGVVSSRAKLFFRSGKPQKSPSVIGILDIEHPQHSVETEPTSLLVEPPTHELTDLHHEPLHPADSHPITGIDSHDAANYELDWDPIANDPIPNHQTPDHLVADQGSIPLSKSESGSSDSKTIDTLVKGEHGVKGDDAIASNHQDHQDHKTSHQDQATSHQETKSSDQTIQPETKGDTHQSPVKEHHHKHHHGHHHDHQDGKPEAKDSDDLANTEIKEIPVKEVQVKEIPVKEANHAIAIHEKDPHPSNPDQKHHDEVTASETKVVKATTEIQVKGTESVVKADVVAPHQEAVVEVKGETGIKGKDAIAGKPSDEQTSKLEAKGDKNEAIATEHSDTQTHEQTSDPEAQQEPEPILIEKTNLLSDVTGGLSTVTDPSGKLSVIWKFDGGYYEGQVGVVPIAGMENYDLNSAEFMKEAIRRALAHIIVDDTTEGAEFSGNMGEGDFNHGAFTGEKTVQLQAGEQFFFVLAPNGRFTDILAGLEKGEMPTGNLRPLFSLATANPESMSHFVQLVDLNGGGTFALEDIRGDGGSDWDLNDIIISVKGANIDAPNIEALVESGIIPEAPKWMETNLGRTILESAIDDLWIEPENLISEKYDFPKENQPLIGFIDTHFTANNPDLDPSRITFGKDYIENDNNPTVTGGQGNHAEHIIGIVGATQDNGLGIDGINDDAPLWVSSAVESGKWADALVEFVDAAIASDQPNAIINLSIDLTQVNPDGSVTTRYEFTPQERGAIEYARQSGVLIVAAAGNDGGVMSVLGQASQEFDNIITVGASDGMNRAAYSSYGYGLDIMAPGGTTENPILSTTGEGVGSMAGTSVATAKVTGAASQVWAANPELSYRQVIEILKETATDLDTPGWDAETGTGLLNMAAAVALARTITPVDYEIPATLIPDTWSGEGKVIPNERAAAAVPMWPTIEPSSFSGSVMATAGANVRSGPGTNFARVGGYGYQTNLQFSGWTYGERVNDVMLGTPDERWYRIAGTNNWIASALIYGNAPGSTPLPPTQTPTPLPGQPKPIVNVPINSGSDNYRKGSKNPFAYSLQGQCTWYAYGRMLETGLLPEAIRKNNLFRGNAGAWKNDAQKVGLPVTSTPTAGARGLVVWPPNTKGAGSVGHVAFLEEVYPDGRVRITESNWPTGSGIKERILNSGQYAGLSFVRLEDVQTNSYYAPPAKTAQGRQYIVRAGDTLSGIAQRELGNANRWTEIKKADGSSFTAVEARNLQVGQSVYLPVNYQVGIGTPVTPPPKSTPGVNNTRQVDFLDFPLSFRAGGSDRGYRNGLDREVNANKWAFQMIDNAIKTASFGKVSLLQSLSSSLQSAVIAGTVVKKGNPTTTLPFYNRFISGVGGEYSASELLNLVRSDISYQKSLSGVKNTINAQIERAIKSQLGGAKSTITGNNIKKGFPLLINSQVSFENGSLYVIVHGTQKEEVIINNLYVSLSPNGEITWRGNLLYDLFDDFGFGSDDLTGPGVQIARLFQEAVSKVRSNPLTGIPQAVSQLLPIAKQLGALGVNSLGYLNQNFGSAQPYGIKLRLNENISGSFKLS